MTDYGAQTCAETPEKHIRKSWLDAYSNEEHAEVDRWYGFCETVPGLFDVHSMMAAAVHTREHLNESGHFDNSYSVKLVAIPGPACKGERQEITHVYDDDGPIWSGPLVDFLRLNEEGYNIYFSPESVGQEIDDKYGFNQIRFVVYVGQGDWWARLPLSPHVYYESAPGVFVGIWLVVGISDQAHEDIMESLVVNFGCLPEFANRSSLIPLPRTYNHNEDFQCLEDIWESGFEQNQKKRDKNGRSAFDQCRDKWGYWWNELIDAFVPPHDNKVTSISIESMSSILAQPKQQEWLIQDYIEDASKTHMYGQPGCGKSFIAMDYALCVATGTHWHGQQVKQGPVVYFAGERAGGMGRRFNAWSTHHGISLDGVPLCLIKTAPNLCNTNDATGLARTLFRQVQEWGEPPKLIIIDTYARHIGSEDENQSSKKRRPPSSAGEARIV